MMAPGPLDALPALLDIVANDERAAELSAAPSKEPMTLKIIRARVRIDFYPSAPAMAVDVRNLLLAARAKALQPQWKLLRRGGGPGRMSRARENVLHGVPIWRPTNKPACSQPTMSICVLC